MRSAPQGEVISLIKEGLQHDSLGKSLVGLANDGKTKRFWVQDDLLYTVGNRLYVPKFGNLRKNLIKECHDTKWAGHPGEATHHSPFELATGQQPLTPQTIMVGYTGRSLGSYKLAKDWQEQADIARSYLDKAARKMKKWADKKRRRVEFQVGDLVLVKLLPQQFKAFRKVHKGLVRKYEGPFPILKKVGKVSYKVELPPRLKIHPVFHVSHLKPYHADTEDPSRGESSRAPTAVVTSYDKEVEEILTDRVVKKRGVPRSSEYLIKWKGLPMSEATWEPKEARNTKNPKECLTYAKGQGSVIGPDRPQSLINYQRRTAEDLKYCTPQIPRSTKEAARNPQTMQPAEESSLKPQIKEESLQYRNQRKSTNQTSNQHQIPHNQPLYLY
ncbi:hypothetical protein ACOSQ4_013211 [Xanthoceras sorbifolium]